MENIVEMQKTLIDKQVEYDKLVEEIENEKKNRSNRNLLIYGLDMFAMIVFFAVGMGVSMMNSNGAKFLGGFLCIISVLCICFIPAFIIYNAKKDEIPAKKKIELEKEISQLEKEVSRSSLLADTEVKQQLGSLNIENLTLQNEGLQLDNSFKKTWKCQYCGNVNAGTELKCISCGGSRE